MSPLERAALIAVGAFVALVLVSAVIGGFFAVTKGDPPPYEPPAIPGDDRADWPEAS